MQKRMPKQKKGKLPFRFIFGREGFETELLIDFFPDFSGINLALGFWRGDHENFFSFFSDSFFIKKPAIAGADSPASSCGSDSLFRNGYVGYGHLEKPCSVVCGFTATSGGFSEGFEGSDIAFESGFGFGERRRCHSGSYTE